jgi:phospholipid/cholesterol/gamma-HCH transport system permease protein
MQMLRPYEIIHNKIIKMVLTPFFAENSKLKTCLRRFMELTKGFYRLSEGIAGVGRMSMLVFSTIRELFRFPMETAEVAKQLYEVGVRSLIVVMITGIISGFVGAVQAFYQLKAISAQGMMGGFVAVLVLKELAPMLTAFVIAARVGTGFAAELGTMNVTEQIDALRVMATSPIKYLVVPRLLACAIMVPLLIIFADITGILGGYFISLSFGLNSGVFFQQFEKFFFVGDIIGGVVKGVVFGSIIAMVGCYRGLYTTGGAEGVGRATSVSAVHSFILIILTDFLLNYFLNAILDVA